MYQARFVEETQSVEELLCKHPYESSAKTTELVLLDQLIQVYAKKLEHQAQMLAVDKSVFKSEEVVIIVFVQLSIQLTESVLSICRESKLPPATTYKIQHRYFHHALIKIGCSVLHDFYRHHFLRFEILAFDHLSKCPLA